MSRGSPSSKPAVAAAGPGCSRPFCVHGSPEHLPCCFPFCGKKGPSRHQKGLWGVLSLVGGPALQGLPSPVVSPSRLAVFQTIPPPSPSTPRCIPETVPQPPAWRKARVRPGERLGPARSAACSQPHVSGRHADAAQAGKWACKARLCQTLLATVPSFLIFISFYFSQTSPSVVAMGTFLELEKCSHKTHSTGR